MVVAGVVAAICASPPIASAVPFGLPLGTAPYNAAPSYPGDCMTYPNTLLGQLWPLPGATGSCIWIHVPTPTEVQAAGGRNISLEPPGTGTVTQVQVSVGAVSGPMQVVAMRALYQNTATPGSPNDACCFPVASSQVFTPTPNSVSTVAVNLPVKEDATPPPDDLTTIADFDTLGLAVLQPGVPVPLYYSGSASQPADFIWNTSQPGTVTPHFDMDTGGFFVAMSADWTAAGTGGGGGGTGGGSAGGGGGGGAGGGALPGTTIPLDFGTGIAPVRNGNANVALRCAGNAACSGRLLLQSAAARGAQLLHAGDLAATGASKKVLTYGSAAFTIAAGKRKQLAVRLAKTARKLLAKHRSTKVWANIMLRSGTVRSYSIRITLHR
jgi:hypothetical protein